MLDRGNFCAKCATHVGPQGFGALHFRRLYAPLLAAWQAHGGPPEAIGRALLGLVPTNVLSDRDVDKIGAHLVRARHRASWGGDWYLLHRSAEQAQQARPDGAVAASRGHLLPPRLLRVPAATCHAADLPGDPRRLRAVPADRVASTVATARVLFSDLGWPDAWNEAPSLWRAATML